MELNMFAPKIQTPRGWRQFLYHDNSREGKTVLKIRWPWVNGEPEVFRYPEPEGFVEVSAGAQAEIDRD